MVKRKVKSQKSKGKLYGQKDQIETHLEKVLAEFIDREQFSSDASFTIWFVTVNNWAKIVAIHSRLLLSLSSCPFKSP